MNFGLLEQMFSTLTAWNWFAFAVVFVIFEMMLGTKFFLLWAACGAVVNGIFLIINPKLTWEYQFILFAVISIAGIIYWYFHLKHNAAKFHTTLNRRNEQYIGRVVTLNDPIVNGRGRIHIDDSMWRIEGPDLPAGTQVKVIGVDGVVLKVAKQ